MKTIFTLGAIEIYIRQESLMSLTACTAGFSVAAAPKARSDLLRLTGFWNESWTVIRSRHTCRSWHS
jgi:hypothetical protein